MNKNMEITVIGKGTNWVIRLSGDVDLNGTPRVRAAIRDALGSGDAQALIVDLERVNRIDSSGMAALLEGFRKADDKQVRFILSSPNEFVNRLLNVTRLSGLLEITGSLEEALRRLGLDSRELEGFQRGGSATSPGSAREGLETIRASVPLRLDSSRSIESPWILWPGF